MNEKGLSQLPSPVKIFIVSYAVLVAVGLLLSLWIVLRSSILQKEGLEEQYPPEVLKEMNAARFYEHLKLAHVHHLGHMFMVFSAAGIYAFTRDKKNTRIQVIVWTTIATLFHTLAFLIYSRLLLIVFGTAYGVLLIYMLVIILIDCYRPVREAKAQV